MLKLMIFIICTLKWYKNFWYPYQVWNVIYFIGILYLLKILHSTTFLLILKKKKKSTSWIKNNI
jgi:hypothetical protein